MVCHRVFVVDEDKKKEIRVAITELSPEVIENEVYNVIRGKKKRQRKRRKKVVRRKID